MFYKEYWFKDKKILDDLKQDVVENVLDWYYYKTNIKGHMTSYKRYTEERKKMFKPVIDFLNEKRLHVIEAWGGVLKKGDYVAEHNHMPKVTEHNTGLNASGVLYLTDVLPGTYFKKYDTTIKPEVGKIIIFGNDLFHEVKPSTSDEDRINIAFNLRKKEDYEF